MRDPAYAAFSALDPFFDIVRQGLAGLRGDHYFDTSLPMRCSSFGIDFRATQQRSWGVRPLWLCIRATGRV